MIQRAALPAAGAKAGLAAPPDLRERASAPPDGDQRAGIGMAVGTLKVADQDLAAAGEAAGERALGLTEQAVGARVDVAAGRLDQAVGVEHERVAALQYAVF